MSRRVVLICGPPGAGKTTYAHTLGLTVYDLDDPQWAGSERTFREAISRLPLEGNAQAAVIRSGATQSARAKASALIGATEVQVIATDADTCVKRVIDRNRDHPPLPMQIVSVRSWWARYQPGHTYPTDAVTFRSTAKRGSTRRGRQWAARVKRNATVCAICGHPLKPALAYPDPMSTVADHIQPWADRPDLRYATSNGQAAHKLCNEQRGRRQQTDTIQSAIW